MAKEADVGCPFCKRFYCSEGDTRIECDCGAVAILKEDNIESPDLATVTVYTWVWQKNE